MSEEFSGPSTSHQKEVCIVHFKESKNDAFTPLCQTEDPESKLAKLKEIYHIHVCA